MERGFRISSHKRVLQFFPRPPDRRCDSGTPRIRGPTGATGHNQVILAVFLEHGRRFHETADKETGVVAGTSRIIVRQFGNMQRAVILRSVDMISLSIVVDKQVHVTCHLPALKIASQQVQRVRMGRQTTATETFLRFFGNRTFMDIQHILRPETGVRTIGRQQLVRSCNPFADSHTAFGSRITGAFRFKMEPHHVPTRLFIENNLWPLQNATFHDRTRLVIRNRQSDSFVFPVI